MGQIGRTALTYTLPMEHIVLTLVQFSSVTNIGGVYQYTLTMETVRDFIFLGSKITADGDHSHEIKRHLLLGRKAMTNLDSILKSRDTTLLTKVHLVNAMVPSSHVWM